MSWVVSIPLSVWYILWYLYFLHSIYIFDRWGNLIWQTEIWGEAGDGRANNGSDIAQVDTYVWKVHVREKESGAKHNYIGHVNIMK